MTLLSCAFEHFTRHLQRNEASRSKPTADQQPTSEMKRRVRRTVCSPARRFPLTLRVARPPTISRRTRFARAYSLTTASFTHARARAMLRATRSRSEAFSSLPESLRWMQDRPSYLYSRPAGTPFSRGHCAMFVASRAKRHFCLLAFHSERLILFMFKLSKKIEQIYEYD